MKQLVKPDLSTVGNIGWCLQFVENAFHTPHSSATARDAWDATRKPHSGNPPRDVAVPVYWDYIENGLDFGHIAVNVPGKGVFSSPYKQDGTHQWFKSLEECKKVLGLSKYLGWSEDLAGVQLISKGEDMPTEEQIRNRFALLGLKPTDAQIALYSRPGATLDDLDTNLLKTARNTIVDQSSKVTAAAKTIADLNKQLSDQGTVLAPGKYLVK